jgi:hypothetical protein
MDCISALLHRLPSLPDDSGESHFTFTEWEGDCELRKKQDAAYCKNSFVVWLVSGWSEKSHDSFFWGPRTDNGILRTGDDSPNRYVQYNVACTVHEQCHGFIRVASRNTRRQQY